MAFPLLTLVIAFSPERVIFLEAQVCTTPMTRWRPGLPVGASLEFTASPAHPESGLFAGSAPTWRTIIQFFPFILKPPSFLPRFHGFEGFESFALKFLFPLWLFIYSVTKLSLILPMYVLPPSSSSHPFFSVPLGQALTRTRPPDSLAFPLDAPSPFSAADWLLPNQFAECSPTQRMGVAGEVSGDGHRTLVYTACPALSPGVSPLFQQGPGFSPATSPPSTSP